MCENGYSSSANQISTNKKKKIYFYETLKYIL